MKVAIVCGHFVPELGYVEVHLANALYRLGNTVKVITSNKTSSSAKFLVSENSDEGINYDIVRLTSWFSYGQLVKSRGISKEIQKFDPEKVIVIGLGKIFPKEVFTIKTKRFELITLLGDNENTYSSSGKSLKRKLLQTLLKTPVYELAIKNSDRLVGYTPSTLEVVETFIKQELKEVLSKKYATLSLGFDEAEFNYSKNERQSTREKMGISDDELVLITATRVTPGKKLEKVIDAIATLYKREVHFKYVIIGFSDFKYCYELKDYIKSKGLSDVIITLSFVARNEMNRYYNMADIGLWTQAAISIFEGLATGLFLLLPKKKNVSHILSETIGDYYSEDELLPYLEKSIVDYNKHSRTKIAHTAKANFSFDVIAQKLLRN